MQVHINEQNKVEFYCDQCPYKAYSLLYMRSHVKVHILKEIRKHYKCSFCPKKFTFPVGKKLHERKHLGIKEEHPCACGKVFTNRSSLISHRNQIHLKKRYPCTKCDKTYATKLSLTEHIEINHQPNRPKAPCELCGKMLPIGAGLRRHRLKHNKNYDCTYEGCSKVFREKRFLVDHLQCQHLPPQKFTCTTCSSSFSSEFRLKVHIKVAHTGPRALCQISGCDYSCSRRQFLNDHYLRHKGIDEELRQKMLQSLIDAKGTKVDSTNIAEKI